jgi:hypothetical protein
VLRTLLVALLAFAAAASPAAAATPCWQRLLDDYMDGRIDATYPVACYDAALRHLPEDVRVYSSAEDDFHRALLAATARKPATRTTGAVKGVRTPVKRETPRRSAIVAATPPRPRADVSRDPAQARASAREDATTSLPLPVLVSAVGGVLLVVAGAASAANARLRKRRAG